MRRLLLLAHVASVAVFAGVIAVLLLFGDVATPASPLTFAAVRQSMAIAADSLLVPALVLLLVTGMLLVVARPLLAGARWLWAKVAASLLAAALAFALLLPALRAATALAVREAAASAMLPEAFVASRLTIEQALRREAYGLWLILACVLVAMALALWRPRLGGRRLPADG